MPFSHFTLLVEDLEALAAALPETVRLPALEYVLARGKRGRRAAVSANHLRFKLFALEPDEALPVAALTRVARADAGVDESYWLRADAVSLRADMTRVFVVSSGFLDYTAEERSEIDCLVRGVLQAEGFGVPQDETGPWCFSVPRPPAFDFTPLHDSLGVDMAEVLPSGPDAADWKRLLTDVQVELHQSEVNRARRERGAAEVNGIWLWGGGSAPLSVPQRFGAVAGDDPVSRGLALISGSPVYAQADDLAGAENVLIDWAMQSRDARTEAEALERRVDSLLSATGAGRSRLTLLSGSGAAWTIDRLSRLKIWASLRPLARALKAETGS
ncbi:MAG: hypothetical protein PVI83_02850 [Lysobacterales bacterium]